MALSSTRTATAAPGPTRFPTTKSRAARAPKRWRKSSPRPRLPDPLPVVQPTYRGAGCTAGNGPRQAEDSSERGHGNAHADRSGKRADRRPAGMASPDTEGRRLHLPPALRAVPGRYRGVRQGGHVADSRPSGRPGGGQFRDDRSPLRRDSDLSFTRWPYRQSGQRDRWSLQGTGVRADARQGGWPDTLIIAEKRA